MDGKQRRLSRPEQTGMARWRVRAASVAWWAATARVSLLSLPRASLGPSRLAFLCVAVSLFAWFLYNAVLVVSQFIRFETIVYIGLQSPHTSPLPAITLCAHCVHCSFNDTEFGGGDVHEAIDEQGQYNQSSGPYFLRESDIVLECLFLSSTVNVPNPRKYNCTDLAPLVVSMQEGHKCFTYFSDLYGHISRSPSATQMTFDLFPKIQLRLSDRFLMGSPSSRYSLLQKHLRQGQNQTNAGIYLTLHTPSVLPDMVNVAYHRLMPNRSTAVRFLKMEEYLRPPPYNTDCFEYRPQQHSPPEVSDVSALSGNSSLSSLGLYRSRGECLLYCIWRTVNNRGCVNFYSLFTGPLVQYAEQLAGGEHLTFCPISTHSFKPFLKQREACKNECKSSCHTEHYLIDNIVDEDLRDNQNLIDIEWGTKPVTLVRHMQKFTLVNFLGNIGGHAHIWLGVSVIRILQYVLAFF